MGLGVKATLYILLVGRNVEGDLLKRSKKTERQRRTGVYLSRVMSCRNNADIGAVFGTAIQAVTTAVREVEKRKEADSRFNLELIWDRYVWASGYRAVSSGTMIDETIQEYVSEQEGEFYQDDSRFVIDEDTRLPLSTR